MTPGNYSMPFTRSWDSWRSRRLPQSLAFWILNAHLSDYSFGRTKPPISQRSWMIEDLNRFLSCVPVWDAPAFLLQSIHDKLCVLHQNLTKGWFNCLFQSYSINKPVFVFADHSKIEPHFSSFQMIFVWWHHVRQEPPPDTGAGAAAEGNAAKQASGLEYLYLWWKNCHPASLSPKHLDEVFMIIPYVFFFLGMSMRSNDIHRNHEKKENAVRWILIIWNKCQAISRTEALVIAALVIKDKL